MKTITILIAAFIGLLSFSACERDTATICENLLEQGIADSINIKGKWEFKYLAKTLNGIKITNKDAIIAEKWIEFENKEIKGSVCNFWLGVYSLSSNNNISINVHSITFRMCDDITGKWEVKLLNALNSSRCYVIKDNELIIHFTGDDDKNIVVLTRK